MGWATGKLWFDSQQQQQQQQQQGKFSKSPIPATQPKQPPIPALYLMIFIILSRKIWGCTFI
jgi:hypothetical protein